MANNTRELKWDILLTANTQDFVNQVTEAKDQVDKQLGNVDIKGITENKAQENFLNDTVKAMNYVM